MGWFVAVGDGGAVEATAEQLSVPSPLCVVDVIEDQAVDAPPEQFAGHEIEALGSLMDGWLAVAAVFVDQDCHSVERPVGGEALASGCVGLAHEVPAGRAAPGREGPDGLADGGDGLVVDEGGGQEVTRSSARLVDVGDLGHERPV